MGSTIVALFFALVFLIVGLFIGYFFGTRQRRNPSDVTKYTPLNKEDNINDVPNSNMVSGTETLSQTMVNKEKRRPNYYVLFSIIGVILFVLYATNPSVDQHKEAAIMRVETYIETSTNLPVRIEENMMKFCRKYYEKSITTKNYGFFSLTYMDFKYSKTNVGIGILGSVYFYKDFELDKSMEAVKRSTDFEKSEE